MLAFIAYLPPRCFLSISLLVYPIKPSAFSLRYLRLMGVAFVSPIQRWKHECCSQNMRPSWLVDLQKERRHMLPTTACALMSYLLALVFLVSVTCRDIRLLGYIPLYRGYCINRIFSLHPLGIFQASAILLSILQINMGVEGTHELGSVT